MAKKNSRKHYGAHAVITFKERGYERKTEILSQKIWKELGSYNSGVNLQRIFNEKIYQPLLTSPRKNARQRYHALLYFDDYLRSNGGIEKAFTKIGEIGDVMCKEERLENYFLHLSREDRGRMGKTHYTSKLSQEMIDEEKSDRPMKPSAEPIMPSKSRYCH